ncbi:MAG: BMP family ABC transporter substrate-binding protein [Oscillospiraceae bacterium]
MKKLIVLVLAMTLALSMFGCSPKTPAATDPSGAPATKEPAKTEELKVALVVNQKFGDKGPMDNLAAGAEKAAKDFGVKVKMLESSSASKFEEDVRAMAKDYDLVITTFPYMSDATKMVAAEYPDTKFAAVFQFVNDGKTNIPNIWDTEFHGEQAFYINGYIAGKLSKTGSVGMIIGAEEPTPNAEGNGFMQGVKAANPDANVEFAFVGSYEDPAKAKEIAIAMIAKGCDVIQTDSGASNAGVVEACKDAGVLCSGEITDFYDSYDGFFGVVGIGFGDTAYKAIEALKDGKFPGGEHGIRGLDNGGYFLDWATHERFAKNHADYGETMTTAIEEAKALEAKIVSGELKIPFNTDVPNWANHK